tara:strand:+ start:124 stop:951 length:828 start_codon:yes stop_codon:yes gene_type:complete
MKLKHNKKRNTAFLYEALVKEITKAVMDKDVSKKDALVAMVKEHFAPGTALRKELDLVKALCETKHVDLYTAERLVSESKKQYDTLDQRQIFQEQSQVIDKINKTAGKQAFNNFVPNYKYLATISQLFSGQTTVKQRVLLERSLIGAMSTKPGKPNKSKEMPHVDKLVFKTVIENFNKKYGDELLTEQKELLNKYIVSSLGSGVEFKVYMNEEIGRLKDEVTNLHEQEVFSENKDLSDKLSDVKEALNKLQTKKIDTALIEKVMQVQKLVKECSE